jgi:glycosyltransferase involved in cell wall biosynthesis
MAEEHDELVSEVRELRSRNQALRTDLERFEDARHVALHLARLLLRPSWRRVRGLVVRLRDRLLRRGRGHHHVDFRAYTVRSHAVRADRPRVLHAVANFATGGSARLVVDLIERLGSVYEQRVIVRKHPPVRSYEGLVIDEYQNLTSTRPLQQLFGAFRPDIVHVHYVASQTSPWGNLDYRWYIHVFEAAAQAGARIIENINIPTEPYRAEGIDRYVFVSDYVRQRYERPGDETMVIHPGSDLDHFRRSAELDRRPDTVGLVYRLERDKLDQHSIDPIIEVLHQRRDARGLVVGGGYFLPAFRRAVAKARVADRVTFTGYVAYADLPRWYERMSVFAAPVHTESFGQVSVFAMGMELPVAGYRVGALEEVLGGSSLLAPSGDMRGLANIVTRLLDDPDRARRIGRENRQRAEQNFSVEGMIDRYRALYRDVATGGEREARSKAPAHP